MNKFVSTRNSKIKYSAREAIIKGLADDGGLFVFEDVRKVDLKRLQNLDYLNLATVIISSIFDELSESDIRECIRKAYSNSFECFDIAPLVKKGNDFFLELYHGPTSAFKDFALTFLPHILTLCKSDDKDIVILTATSGDTGKAALEGFKDVKGTRIKVLYPYRMVSEIQERQMVTTGGDNTEVIAVRGNFDDCQRMAKDILENEKFDNIHLTSANSINIARLVPQIVYYFKAYFDLLNQNEIEENEKIDFVVPTGNFGDIMAGYLAKEMGLPVNKLICASNMNNVLTEFFETGHYDANREFYNTMAPSIDILVSSNLERLLYYKSMDSEKVRALMMKLKENREYQIDDQLLKSIQKDFAGLYTTEEEVNQVIYDYYNRYHYVIDTHTAVAASASLKVDDGFRHVVLSTASPFKFSRDVYKALTNVECENDYVSMQQLSQYADVKIPENLARLDKLEVRFTEVIDSKEVLIEKLRGLK